MDAWSIVIDTETDADAPIEESDEPDHLLSKKGSKDQETIQSNTTPDPGYYMGKWQKKQLNITNESQEVSPFQAGDHRTAMNRRESMTNTRHK